MDMFSDCGVLTNLADENSLIILVSSSQVLLHNFV